MNAQLPKDAGGTLFTDPTEAGRPSAATVALYQRDGTVLRASGSATIDPVNTTLSAVSYEGDETITLASVAGVVIGRDFWLMDSTGQVERVRVRAVDTGTKVVTVEGGLSWGHASGTPFVGGRISTTVTIDEAATLAQGYEARWTYTIAESSYRARTRYDVVRTPWPMVILTPFELGDYIGDLASPLMERAATRGTRFAREIAIATERLRTELLVRGVRPDLFHGFDEFKRVVAFGVVRTWAEDGVNIPQAWQNDAARWLDERRGAYTRALDEALAMTESYDADDNAAVSDDEAKSKPGRVVFCQ